MYRLFIKELMTNKKVVNRFCIMVNAHKIFLRCLVSTLNCREITTATNGKRLSICSIEKYVKYISYCKIK